jgi:Na+-transporting methylmalonyl-CoA/oxaloacetate decarboxylase gamma subunit
MEEPLPVALVISAIGMTLLFLSLILFYGMLSLLMSVTRERATSGAAPEAEPAGAPETMLRAAAIAIAVAIARAEAEPGPSLVDLAATAGIAGRGQVSPWWTLHHQRQMIPHPKARREQ